MPRPTKEQKVQEPPKVQGLRPVGIPARLLERVYLTLGEYEAIRLVDQIGFDHQKAAEAMGISRPTFTRTIEKARKKIAEAIVSVKELVIQGGNYSFTTQMRRCVDCGALERFNSAEELTKTCRNCGSTNMVSLNEWFGGRGGGRGVDKRAKF